jgi:hypothetical protein
LPATTTQTPDAVAANKLKKWITARAEEKLQEPDDVRYELYSSLIDQRIRKAWVSPASTTGAHEEVRPLTTWQQLFQLYLNPSNTTLLNDLYIKPCSFNPFVQLTIAHQLCQAAEAEIVKSGTTNVLVEQDIMSGAQEAFSALSNLLGGDEWFFGKEKPGLMDAIVFAYTHLLLSEGMKWGSNDMGRGLDAKENLVRHQERIAELYF